MNLQPAARESALPFFCFTDRPEDGGDWRIKPMLKAFPADQVRSQRLYKFLPHLVLPEFDESLYIDNSVILKQAPERLFEAADLSAGMALPLHSFRARLRDEFEVVASTNLDDPARVAAQLADYEAAFPAILDRTPFWNGIILRDHRNRRAAAVGQIWAAHLCRYSRRDQLSLPAALHLAGLRPDALPLDNHESDFHSWPHIATRQTAARFWEGEPAPENPLKARVDELEAAIEQLSKERAALLESSSWRVTAPLRRAVHFWRGGRQAE